VSKRVCVCVREREKEKERQRERERIDVFDHTLAPRQAVRV